MKEVSGVKGPFCYRNMGSGSGLGPKLGKITQKRTNPDCCAEDSPLDYDFGVSLACSRGYDEPLKHVERVKAPKIRLKT